MDYRIRASIGFGGVPSAAMDWVETDGAISNTGKFPGSTPDDDRVRVIIRFKKTPVASP